MRFILPVLLGLALAALLLRVFLNTPPAELARRLRMAAGVALILVGVGLLLLRQFALALPVGMTGFMILRRETAARTTSARERTSGTTSKRCGPAG